MIKELNNLLVSFQDPERSIKVGIDPKVTAFEFNHDMQKLFMGFKNGEVTPIYILLICSSLHFEETFCLIKQK